MVAEILQECFRRKAAPTRIASAAGVNMSFVNACISSGLLEVSRESQRKVTVVTEKGQNFLQHLRAATGLMPRELLPECYKEE